MRKMLFRGIRKDTHEWVYGFYGEYFNGKKNISCISVVDTHAIAGSFCYEVIPETVSQFTGLYDKNGVRIWENDIVRFTRTPSWLYQVIWDKESAMFGLKCVKSQSIYNKEACGTNFYDIDSRDVEIIGNVFDNSDLLKGE